MFNKSIYSIIGRFVSLISHIFIDGKGCIFGTNLLNLKAAALSKKLLRSGNTEIGR